MENDEHLKKIKMLTVILDKGKGKRVIKFLQEKLACRQFATLGYGTANKAMFDYLGLGQTSKDIVFALIQDDIAPDIMQMLNEEFELYRPNTGLAFTIPLESVASMSVLQYILGETKEI